MREEGVCLYECQFRGHISSLADGVRKVKGKITFVAFCRGEFD